MCSILFTNKKLLHLEKVNFYNKLRGPDFTNLEFINGYYFLHNLLSITGAFTKQPFAKKNIVCIYNGEIYNENKFGNAYSSDGECIIDAYLTYGECFPKKLEGEFAILLVDFNRNICIISSDIFKTKPLYYSIDDKFIGVSTYADALIQLGHTHVTKFSPNTTIVIDLSNNRVISSKSVYDFDIQNQHKANLDDWTLAFRNAIKKRCKNTSHKVFIGLSSGYDSGAICKELLNQEIDFKAYTIIGTENQKIINERISILDKNNIPYTVLNKKDKEIHANTIFIKKHTEQFKYTISSSSSTYNEFDTNLTDDGGSRFLSLICSHAKKDGYKIFISGVGPDELFSDYGFNGKKIYPHSNFGGLFPKDLSSIFPWNSFYGSTMESYLAKDEYVGGSFGLEVRYPYLDKDVVQEFLWLTADLKNKSYKSPLYGFLISENYPFQVDEKLGF